MEQKENTVRISVRNLVEFVLRSGDIDRRHTAAADKEAMLLGARLHRKLQKAAGPSYKAEVPLKYRIREDEFEILVEGRADGVITETGRADGGKRVTVDEIKGIYGSLDRLDEPVPVHEAQALCYAFILAEQEKLPDISVRVTYVNMETEEIRRFTREKSFEELDSWFRGLIHEYVKWARLLYHHRLRRDESVKDLAFPFPYRPGQRELAVYVYRTEERHKYIFVQAPTGIGKTLAVLYPSVKALYTGHGNRVFYLTAKTVTASVAEEGLAILRGHGLVLNAVTIMAREKLCALETPSCNPADCPRAAGHFDRVNDALFDLLCTESAVTREVLLEYAGKYRVCPYELALDVTDFSDLIICDYNYAFDPEAKLQRFFAAENGGDSILLVDEAHNLPDRVREMYSAALKKEEVLSARKIIAPHSKKLAGRLMAVNKALLTLKKETEETYRILGQEEHGEFLILLRRFLSDAEDFLEEPREFEGREEFLQFYFTARHYLGIGEELGPDYRIYAERLSGESFMIREFCINPAQKTGECLKAARSAVFFSATLLPMPFYRELIHNDPEDYAVSAPSPFPAKNRRILIASDVTSRYSRRGEAEYRRVLSCISACAEARTGNYIAFFPSYRFLGEVLALAGEEKRFEILVQEPGMGEDRRREFLREFEKIRTRSLVAFCVMGGIFGEGIDLSGEKLIGCLVVGTGLPMVCTEQDILKNAFSETGRDGFAFAFRYPGMNRVLQAAGRVIRTPEDRGVILLLDERFRGKEYRTLFPEEWNDVKSVTSSEIAGELKEFWDSFPD